VSWFKQVLTQKDNRTFDGAYISLAVVIGLVVFVVLNLLVMAWIDLLSDYDNQFNYLGLGGGIASIIGAIGGFLAGVGGFILMDRKGQAAIDGSTTTTESQSTVVKTVAAAPAAAQPDALLAAGRGVEPLSPKIGPEDVGRSVAIVKPRPKRRKK
jgi:hypothetical protein